MKQELERIYRELAAGGLSKAQALQRIRALRNPAGLATLLVSPDWEPTGTPGGEPVSSEERHVLLAGFSAGEAQALASQIPANSCTSLLFGPGGGPSRGASSNGASSDEGAATRDPSDNEPASAYARLALAIFEVVQRLLAAKPRVRQRVQLVVAGDDEAYWCAGLSGLFETARLENPLLRGQIVFVRAHAEPAVVARQVCDEWRERDGGVVRLVRYAPEGRLVRRWQVVCEAASEGAINLLTLPKLLKEQGVYLITGGGGGLGRLFAQEILRHEARACVVLAGRHVPDDPEFAALRQQGRVEFRALDVSDFEQTDALVRAIVREYGQLNGILHGAGLLRDEFIVRKSASAFAEVLAPKVAGTANLDRATRALELDFMLLFSSIAAWAGNPGQADYAAAQGFVEQFAVYRSGLAAAGERHGLTLAIAWPHWLDGGMQIDPASMDALQRRTGLRSLSTEAGIEACYRCMALDLPQVMVMHGEPAMLRHALSAQAADPLPQLAPGATVAIAPDNLRELTRAYLRETLAPELKLPAGRIDPWAPFEQYGINSIVAMNLTSRLEERFGTLAKTLFFEYQSLDELAGYFVETHVAKLCALLAAPVAATTPAPAAVAPARGTARRVRRRMSAAPPRAVYVNEPIAVVGLSGRYPQAPDLDAYWRNLREGRDCIVEIPRERWDWRDYYSAQPTQEGAHFSKWGGFIDGVDEFDPRFFNIAPRDAAAIDPQERLFLQHAWMAIEDAGYTRASLQISYDGHLPGQVGVYAGVMYGEYNLSGSLASIANRVSYFLNLHGPSLTLDTMCSSSLTALHLACQDLRIARTSLALAGGVNVSIHPNKYAMLSTGRFLSGEGHCQSFGEGGDGYIPGEGVGVAVLKRLADARRDGNHIYGVIRGSALNHGGKTNGYTVPNPRAQAEAIRLALADAGVAPERISYLEAHGTGTRLGDPIEIAALAQAFNENIEPAARRTGFCRIGSAKSNIGHCESAAGIAGVTKVLLQMKHSAIVPSLHSARLNPHIDFDATPFVVNQALVEWPESSEGGQRVPRVAGVSSFGAGGSNAHLIIEEYLKDAAAPEVDEAASRGRGESFVVPLSARTGMQLQQRARDLLAWLEQNEAVEPLALAYTLQVGREAMDERAAFVVATLAELREQLRALAHGAATPLRSGRAQVKARASSALADPDAAGEAEVEHAIAQRALPTLARYWVEGRNVDWQRLHAPGKRPTLISLPPYPFARERYWIEPMRTTQAPPALHPLVHINTSDLYEQRHTSRFSAAEAFVAAGAAPEALSVAGSNARPAVSRTIPVALSTVRAEAAHSKPASIALPPGAVPAAAEAIVGSAVGPLAKAAVTLADPASVSLNADATATPVALLDLGEGVFRIDIGTAELIDAVVPLAHALELVQREAALQVLLLADTSEQGWCGARATCNALLEQGVLTMLAGFPGPVIVLAPFGATGAGWLLSLAGDFMVLGAESSYGYTDAASGLFPDVAEDRLFRARLGDVLADDCLYRATRLTGEQLRERGWTCRIPPMADSQANALQLARELARKTPVALRLLAGHLRRGVAAAVAALVPAQVPLEAALATAFEPVVDTTPQTPGAGPDQVLHRTSVDMAEVAIDAIFDATRLETFTNPGAPIGLAGALVLELGAGHDSYDLAALRSELETAIERARTLDGCRSIVLRIVRADLLREATRAVDEAAARALLDTLFDAPLPVVAAFEADAEGLAWLLGLACDAAVYRRDAYYGVAGLGASSWLDQAAAALGALRTGSALNQQMCFAAERWTGGELHARNGALAVVGQADVLPLALTLAACWRDWRVALVRKWKTAQAARLRVLLDAGQAAALDGAAMHEPTLMQGADSARTDAAPVSATAERVPLRSAVVTATAWPDGVVVVAMHDLEAKNLFTPALVDGLREAFAYVDAHDGCKVVVLTGIDHYFATGGTRETLLAIQQGRARFTDERVFELPMACPVPVITALQGHALGSGWSFGMFADLVILGEESCYISPYMNYGFTPGGGATLVFPARLGIDLARESLLTAADLSGAELRARGIGLQVLPRREVSAQALALAQRIARQPRVRLVRLKRQFTAALRDAREAVYARELEMHEATFVRNANTLAQIEERYADSARVRADAGASAAVVVAAAPLPAPGSGAITQRIRQMLAEELGLMLDEVDDDARFIDLGLDSISGVTWIRKINAHYGTSIEATLVYSHPSLNELATYLAGVLGMPAAPAVGDGPGASAISTAPGAVAAAAAASLGVNPPPARSTLSSGRGSTHAPQPGVPAPVASTHARALHQPVAVIGMAGQFPKARDVDTFWRNLAAGLDCVDEVDDARWRVRDYFQAGAPAPGKTYSRWLGALDAYDCFDPLFFNISPAEAECMDPQQRLFLQAAWHCIENAGYSARALSGSACGVFAGCGSSDYLQGADDVRLSAQGFTGAATSILAARIAYCLDLHGPCVSLDTACSSSLVALANACDSLNAGHCDAALAGGVYVMGGPSMHIMTAQAGMLSPDGRCYTFDQRANGFVPGEAVGVLMLKRLADAERDGDRIQAVLHGWGVNQDGRTNGITAPNQDAQSRLLKSVYRRFGLDPDDIGLFEAHGTGTKLGDPIEVAGLKSAFQSFTQRTGYCALGSVKSNIGHCLTAAGAAGIIKLVQALRHRQLPPTLHYRMCNEHIRLDSSPFYVNDRLAPWTVEAGRERRAAISSFGFSGTNAHIVLGEYVMREPAGEATAILDPAGRIAVPLSARNGEQLRQKAHDLLAFLRGAADSEPGPACQGPPDLIQLAYTLQMGRDAMEERVGFLVASSAELSERLAAYLAGDTLPDGVYEGVLKQYRDGIRLLSEDPEVRAALLGKWFEQRRLDKLLELWAKGLEVDWNLLYGEVKPRRIALPNYPFAAARYWHRPTAALAAAAQVHPLVHRNISVLSQQRYQSSFDGGESCFDLRVGGLPGLSPASILEMARGALADATVDLGTEHTLTLREVRWTTPLPPAPAAGDNLEIAIRLAARENGAIGFEIGDAGEALPTLLAQGTVWLNDARAPSVDTSGAGIPHAGSPRHLGQVDLAELRARCTHAQLDSDGAYTRLAGAGLSVGPALRTLGLLEFGEHECLAAFDERSCAATAIRGCVLQPGIIDGAWQVGWLCAMIDDVAPRLLLPDTLDSLTFAQHGAAVRFAWVRRSEPALVRFDIDLLDEYGFVVSALRGLALAPATSAADVTNAVEAASTDELEIAAPVWDCLADQPTRRLDPESHLLVLSASTQHMQALSRHFPQAVFIAVDGHATVTDLTAQLAHAEFDRLIWIVDAKPAPDLTDESLVEEQASGLLLALRLARALAGAGLETRALAWDWVTLGTVALDPAETANPTHAGLLGLCGSMADAFPHWALRLCDLPDLSEATLAALGTPPAAARGGCYAWRGGEWFGQRLLAVRTQPSAESAHSPYRTHGVYVVIGGAGGLGEIWTRHVLAQCEASVVWIGRRPLNPALAERLKRAEVQGRRPDYLQADASDRAALDAAYREIKRRYGAIHGVVHSAVGAFDQSLKTVSEADFRAILGVKLDLSVRIAQVFAAETLDFVLFFSSNASFVRGAGMAGYSAGCAFADAFALQLDRVWQGAVKVVNWGYWNVGAGAAVSPALKTFFEASGYRPIEAAPGMRALDALLVSPLRQWSISNLAPGAAARLADGDESLSVPGCRTAAGAASAPLADLERLPAAAFDALRGRAGEQLEPLLARLLATIVAAVPEPAPQFSRWLVETRKIITACEAHAVSGADDLDAAWRAWDAALPDWLRDDGQSALVRLVDRCMRALPDILSGARTATGVIFPDASLELVEQVYKTDAHALAFNASLCHVLMSAFSARIAAEPLAQFRLLEIGAGTGATSAGILEQLGALRGKITEYCYTDISKAFLLYADQAYAPGAPFLRTHLFDVEQPLDGQGIEAGSYDIVIAANVMHATKNIRHALRNAKALLRQGGMLLMNEISRPSMCGHVTFGLLDGWWLNEDEALRIPGSPGLEPHVWRRVLEAEGFAPVLMPHPDSHAAGQQIIAAFSDGVVRQHAAALRVGTRSVPTASVPTKSAQADATLHEFAVRFCTQLVGKVLKLDPRQVDAHEPLEHYGIDSIVIGLVNQQLQQHFTDIGSTLLFQFRTIDALAGHLLQTEYGTLARLAGAAQAQQPTHPMQHLLASAAAPRATRVSARAPLSLPPPAPHTGRSATIASSRGPVAIVGLSGIYPQAQDLDAFWRNLQSGRDSIGEIPSRRWPLDSFYEADEQRAVEAGLSYCKWGGFVDCFAEFDCLFFGITPREALNMDPQERMFMQAAWHALENAGYTRAALHDTYGRRVGVFAGITRAGYNLYRDLHPMHADENAKFRPRTSFASVANRLSYFLDVNGPSLPIDTMCSSSLTAIHEACEHIHNGDCDLALAGGVNLYLHATSYIDMASQHMLAPDGRCKSFGEGGNGFVPGEGVGVVLLKPLERAIRDGDTIHGVILATHVNHGGKTNGYTVPNPLAQAELVRTALDKAGISARELSYIEAHGTGTELGDPIEIAGLQQAFSRDTQDRGFCALGSVKSNIGHLEAAAGIAALTKVLLQFRHQQIAPSLHATTLNPHIHFERTPFRVSQRLSPWTPPVVDGVERPRTAGISSFGAGGANAHVIVQEYRAAQPVERAHGGPVVVPLSARTATQLRQMSADLLGYLQAQRAEVDLAALAYTLQTGREAMEERLGLSADNVGVLEAQLAAYAQGERLADGAYRGRVLRASERSGAQHDMVDEYDGTPTADDGMCAIDDGPQAARLPWSSPVARARLLERWVRGGAVDWWHLYDGAPPRHIELPGYPFAKDEYWPDTTAASPTASVQASVAVIAGADEAHDFARIEAVLGQIDRAELDVSDAARLIRSLV